MDAPASFTSQTRKKLREILDSDQAVSDLEFLVLFEMASAPAQEVRSPKEARKLYEKIAKAAGALTDLLKEVPSSMWHAVERYGSGTDSESLVEGIDLSDRIRTLHEMINARLTTLQAVLEGLEQGARLAAAQPLRTGRRPPPLLAQLSVILPVAIEAGGVKASAAERSKMVRAVDLVFQELRIVADAREFVRAELEERKRLS